MTWRLLIFCAFFFSILTASAQSRELNSSFGKVFTPKGDLHMLIIFAGFEGYDHKQAVGSWAPENPIPPWNWKDLFYADTAAFIQHEKDTLAKNLSKFYYELSHPKKRFRLTADVFPHRININPQKGYGFAQYNRLVMEAMHAQYPDFDWKPYDKRTNLPNYKFDNSLTRPDQKPDYVIIAYRYSVGWNPQPQQGMNTWAPVYSRLDGLNGLNFNGYTFDGAGFTMGAFDGRPDYFKDLFIHELAHELYSSPHYSGANGALGNYFYLPAVGWDFMSSMGGTTCNAFERWLLGWTDIKYDLNEKNKPAVYELSDFVTSGDAIRIKIPHTANQHLWIEYHQLQSVFDHKPWRGHLLNQPSGSKGIPDKEAGIYMFIESMLTERAQITESLVYEQEKVNGILPLHAAGNFDYIKPVKFTHSPEEYWNNKLYWFTRGEANPIAGINPFVNYRNDMDSNGVINHIYSPFGAFNGMKDAENYPIVKEILAGKPTLTYANIIGRNADALPHRRSDAFQAGDYVGINSNPMVTNRPEFDLYNDSLTPFYINSLSIRISQIKNGKATIAINFDDTDINKNSRWCGNVVLQPLLIRKNDYDLRLVKNVKLLFNNSAIPNKIKAPFVSPTVFTLDSGVVMILDVGAQMMFRDSSQFVLKSGSTLIIKNRGSIVLEDNSQLLISTGAKVILNNKAFIYSKNKHQILVKSGNDLNRPQNVVPID